MGFISPTTFKMTRVAAMNSQRKEQKKPDFLLKKSQSGKFMLDSLLKNTPCPKTQTKNGWLRNRVNHFSFSPTGVPLQREHQTLGADGSFEVAGFEDPLEVFVHEGEVGGVDTKLDGLGLAGLEVNLGEGTKAFHVWGQ